MSRAGAAFCQDCFKVFYVHRFSAASAEKQLTFLARSFSDPVPQGISSGYVHGGAVLVGQGVDCGQSPKDRELIGAKTELMLQPLAPGWRGPLGPSPFVECPFHPVFIAGAF